MLKSLRWLLGDPNRIIAAFTVGLFVIGGIGLWIARDTEQRQLRAYVFAESATLATTENGLLKVSPVGGEGDARRYELFVNYTLTNVGQTPAYNVTRLLALNLREYPLRQNIPMEASHGTLAYLSKPQSFGPVISRWFSQDDLNVISAGNDRRLYFAGQIFYYDIFKKSRQTNFCFMYGRVLDAAPQFIPCDRWNDTDTLTYAN